MVAGHLTQSLLIAKYVQKNFLRYWAPRFPPFSTPGLLGVVLAMALKAAQLVAQARELPKLQLVLLSPACCCLTATQSPSLTVMTRKVDRKWM